MQPPEAIHSRAAAARLAYSTHDRTMQNHLGACRSAYNDALGSLRAAATLMKTSKDNREAIISDISAAMRSVKTCEDNFREAPGMAFPLRRVNNSLMKMVKNSLAIGSQLK
ncbi:uncharacterized protein A4U43_C06F5620 [Asparagus officinalis]|uniref:Pectinesterase inhibitor domain-containing protein n=1 Tax=Asparagus officinalis TaxID=4686 RepID=A0A5P1EJS4_ASPOF|nr:uncharacterized protein A4U43_C06F5620 [Asparagus officinalis]